MLWMIAGNKVRVYCEVGKSNQGKFAMDVLVRTLPYYDEYSRIPKLCGALFLVEFQNSEF